MITIPLREIARGHWHRILPQFGIAREYLVNRHGPCPACGGTDRFRFDNIDDYGTFFCNRCGAGDGIALVMLVTGNSFAEVSTDLLAALKGAGAFAEPAPYRRSKPVEKCTSEAQYAAMRALWNMGVSVQAGDPVALYLASRGVGVSPRLKNLRTVILDGRPTMLARVQHGSSKIMGTSSCQLHRTMLACSYPAIGDYTRERKLMPGVHPPGSAVRLFEADREVLGIAEGIETALSAAIMFQVPVWACLTAGRLATFIPPPGVRQLRIFADNDDNGVGFEAARTAALALDKVGYDVTIEVPEKAGEDWNDVLASFMARSLSADAVGASDSAWFHSRGERGYG